MKPMREVYGIAVQGGVLILISFFCSFFQVGGEAWDDTAAGVVRHLTQLRSIFWEGSEGLTDTGLQELTALQGLTILHVFANPGVSKQLLDDGKDLEEGGDGALILRASPREVGTHIKLVLTSQGSGPRRMLSSRLDAAIMCDSMHHACCKHG